jgi:hypothetical protein
MMTAICAEGLPVGETKDAIAARREERIAVGNYKCISRCRREACALTSPACVSPLAAAWPRRSPAFRASAKSLPAPAQAGRGRRRATARLVELGQRQQRAQSPAAGVLLFRDGEGGLEGYLGGCEVVESRHPDYRAGEIVAGWFGWQELATVDAGAVVRRAVETDLRIRSLSECSASTASRR